MLRTRTISYLLALAVGAGSVVTLPAVLGDSVADAGPAKKKKAKKKKKAAPKSIAPAKLSADQKKARAEMMGSFKFGMTKDEVIAALAKQLDERYAELIKETEDIHKQDQLRKEKGRELNRIKKSYVAFDGQKSGWDASIVSDEFKHTVGESMLEYWENQAGKNQRRFFFFDDGALYKMVIQIDTSQFQPDQQNFEFFAGIMKAKYGSDVVEPKITIDNYRGDVYVKALDKTRMYDAFVLVVADTSRAREVAADRKERIPEVKEENAILKAVVESGDTSGPGIDQNKDAVQGIIGDKK